MSAKMIITRKEQLPLPDRTTVINETEAQEVDMKLTMAFSGLYDDPMEIDIPLDLVNSPVENAPKPREKEVHYVLNPGSSRSFLFHPSFARTYVNLKQCHPDLAVDYIEALMNYGCYGFELPNDPLLRAVMDGIVETIEKSYEHYVVRKQKAKNAELLKEEQEAQKSNIQVIFDE